MFFSINSTLKFCIKSMWMHFSLLVNTDESLNQCYLQKICQICMNSSFTFTTLDILACIVENLKYMYGRWLILTWSRVFTPEGSWPGWRFHTGCPCSWTSWRIHPLPIPHPSYKSEQIQSLQMKYIYSRYIK